MNTLLRNIFAGLSLSLLLATGCGTAEDLADVQDIDIEQDHSALTTAAKKANMVVDVADPNAAELISSLQAAGATLRVVPDASFLTVTSLSCSLGKTSSSCSMMANGHAIQAGTTRAKAIASSLKKASLTSQLVNGLTVYKAKKVDCNIGTFTGRPISSCQLTVPAP